MTPIDPRISPDARRPARMMSSAERFQHGWAQRTNSVAAAALVLSSALTFGSASAQPGASQAGQATHADERFDAAVRLYESGHWEQAFADLAALADRDHLRAARLALLMLRYGAPLYGATFAARPGQVARWAQRVLRASSRATASPSSMTASA